ncbi:polysaccharide deacetylase [Cohnella sp. CIP 111063]|jgi:polysaccharide deacetylase family sporulation protein PdaB|uniref:polysaccharide deacetylase family protein n=1 Tax=unclassified Cohnella TaxID=2636738 RepID=UPI000B8C59F1|nr:MULTISPECIES: polysaccharide deacetylase family protein [unclassified Cohnella]OXS58237.1 polysaccharide deacetylase [Cohnella sp. CIP 111063]PRX71511.1 polysaccharide deacetylase family sporulation protein PdaB [Cohnella sp. SGD-V74]
MSVFKTATLIGVCVSAVVACGYNQAQAQPHKKTRAYYEEREEVVWEVPMKEKLIALTFDDGPNPVTTPKILDLLAANDAKSTFFVVGKRMDRYPDVVRREAKEGHEVANHTYNHLYLNHRISQQRLEDELSRTEKQIVSLTGKHSLWFRPPGGFFNDSVVRIARERGYTMVLWSWHQDTKDWSSPGTRRIVDRVLKNVRNGDIVLFHDHVEGSMQTVQALETILPELRRRGYRMVTVSELIQHKKSNLLLGKPHS